MHFSHRHHSITTLVLLSGMAVALMFAPDRLTQSLRNAAGDLILPGLLGLDWSVQQMTAVRRSWQPALVESAETRGLRMRLADAERRNRGLQVEAARLREELQSKRAIEFPHHLAAKSPLLLPELLPATVLGSQRTEFHSAALLIDRGSADRILETLPVVEGEGPVVDRGEDSGVQTGLPVFAGTQVIGKIAGVGRWASTVRLVTDATFRGSAQLLRKTSYGHAFGAQGVLEGGGEGELCRLKRVGIDEQVRVGDLVVTADESAVVPQRLYYGRVTRAELHAGALEWDIWVDPELEVAELRRVRILRMKWNPIRQMAN